MNSGSAAIDYPVHFPVGQRPGLGVGVAMESVEGIIGADGIGSRTGKMLASLWPRCVNPTGFPFSSARTSEPVLERNSDVEIIFMFQV